MQAYSGTLLSYGATEVRGNHEKIAKAISTIFNAPLVAIYDFTILILFLNLTSPLPLLVVCAFFVCILPYLVMIYMVRAGIIPDMFASDRRTRTKPFLAVIGSYAGGMIALILLQAPRMLTALMACYVINSIVMMLITQVWKISVHASGIAGPSTFLLHQLGIVMLPFFLLVLPIGWARLELRAHTRNQVLAGALLTMGLTLVQVQLYLK